MMDAKNLRARIVLVMVSVSVALALGEILVRAVVPELGRRPLADPSLGWASREYTTFEPHERAAGDHRKRVLFLGDSFLAGAMVSRLDQRFSDVLHQLRPEFDVATLAAGAWGTDQELLAFVSKGRAWRPDLVIVAFCANNDLANILSNHHGPQDGQALLRSRRQQSTGAVLAEWCADPRLEPAVTCKAAVRVLPVGHCPVSISRRRR